MLTLCDCPGLVFPSFVASTGEMICAGVLPINQMREHRGPVGLIASRIPRHIFELTYTLRFPREGEEEEEAAGEGRPLTATELLEVFCQTRHYFMGASGQVDEQRASRYLLQDYTEGKVLLFCHPPPSLSPPEVKDFLEDTTGTMARFGKVAAKLALEQRKLEAAGGSGGPVPTSLKGAEEIGNKYHKNPGSQDRPRVAPKKKWGKKGKKMRNKTPYDEDNLLYGDDSNAGSGAHTAGKRGVHGFTRVERSYLPRSHI